MPPDRFKEVNLNTLFLNFNSQLIIAKRKSLKFRKNTLFRGPCMG